MNNNLIKNIDWWTIIIYLCLLIMGWINIYSSSYDDSNYHGILDFSQKYGKQIIWIGASFIIAFLILLTDSKFFSSFSVPIYLFIMMLLIAVTVFGKEINGARAWFEIGNIALQPAEFGKFATNLCLAFIMSKNDFRLSDKISLFKVSIIILLPATIIILQNDMGSALVYASFMIVLFRHGMYGLILVLGIVGILVFITTLLLSSTGVIIFILLMGLLGYFYYRPSLKEIIYILSFLVFSSSIIYTLKYFELIDISNDMILIISIFLISIIGIYIIYRKNVNKILFIIAFVWGAIIMSFSVGYAFDKLQQHQKDRINNLLGIKEDPRGIGYNVNQSKIAIGSGGFSGKGFLEGTQTKLNFVPEQTTDFIFCTVGEEWGFIGSSTVIIFFMLLIIRIIILAERQRASFSRIYGYGVASIIFFHVVINIGMTIGVLPVIGIPLPFFSYGGSSLWAFTILIFIFIRLDANRLQIFR